MDRRSKDGRREVAARNHLPTLLLQGTPELGGLMSDADVTLATRLLTITPM